MDAILTGMYNSGECSAGDIAEKLKVTVQTVYPHMRLLGLPLLGEAGCGLRNYKSYGPRYNELVFSKEQEALIVLRNGEGKHDSEIARELGIPEGPIRKFRKKLDLPAHSCVKLIPVGARFGCLVVRAAISPERKRGADSEHGLSSRSLCLCDCGKECPAFNEDLRSGNKVTCGCRIDLKNPDSEWIRVFHSVKSSAKSRNLEMGLSLLQVKHLCTMPCFYCGLRQSNSTMPPKRGRDSRTSLMYNGIDQVVPCGGYRPGNVLPCCSICNRAKDNQSLDEFLPWVNRLHGKQFTKEGVLNAANDLGEELNSLVAV